MVFRPLGNAAKLRISLKSINSDNTKPVVDGVIIAFDDNFKNKIDEFDATKLPISSVENLTMLKNESLLSIKRKYPVTQADTMFLNLNFMKVKSYTLEIECIGSLAPAIKAFILDAETELTLPINVSGTSLYNFNVSAGFNPNRLFIIL